MSALSEVRTDLCDYPTAWRLQRERGTASPPHHSLCSAHQTQGAFLCDCNEVLREWRLRVKLQTGEESPRYRFAEQPFAESIEHSETPAQEAVA